MRHPKTALYEGLYILRTTLSDPARELAYQKIITLIGTLGGTHEKTIDWGRKKLASKIRGAGEGHYYLIYFSIQTDKLEELHRENRLYEDLILFMHIAIDAVPEGDSIVFKPIIQQVERTL